MASSSLVERIPSIVAGVRDAYDRGVTRPASWRYEQLRQVIKLIQENRALLSKALKADLGVNDFWVEGVELEGSINEAKDAIEHLATWMKPESVSTPLVNLPASSYVQREPYGVVLIIAPWNYPVSLLLNPLIASLAAGNAAVLKPSEVSVETSRTLAELIPKYFNREVIAVVEGAVEETTALLKERFDLIMYTGNGAVGRIVMKAAAEHLTPVILELGGKCPAIVADDADVKKTARRLAWGKWTMNNGQTCVSPDYVLTSAAMRPKLLAEFKTTLAEFYGAEPKDSKDISRMINERHCKRVADLLDDKTNIDIVVGGQVNIAERYIAPTILTCGPDAKIMRDEIFGPVLPVLTVDNLDAAIAFVNKREKPLALYVFSESSATAQRTIASTSSGGACINDVIMQVGNCALPFGGVGPSGMGHYHGKWGFDSFSHKKAVFVKYFSDPSIRYPPYNASKLALLARLRGLTLGGLKRPLMIAAFVAVAAVAMRYKF